MTTTTWIVGDGSGQLRLSLLPETERACTRVVATTRGIAGGPMFNNGPELLQWARDIVAACEDIAPQLHPGPPPPAPVPPPPVCDGQGALFTE